MSYTLLGPRLVWVQHNIMPEGETKGVGRMYKSEDDIFSSFNPWGV